MNRSLRMLVSFGLAFPWAILVQPIHASIVGNQQNKLVFLPSTPRSSVAVKKNPREEDSQRRLVSPTAGPFVANRYQCPDEGARITFTTLVLLQFATPVNFTQDFTETDFQDWVWESYLRTAVQSCDVHYFRTLTNIETTTLVPVTSAAQTQQLSYLVYELSFRAYANGGGATPLQGLPIAADRDSTIVSNLLPSPTESQCSINQVVTSSTTQEQCIHERNDNLFQGSGTETAVDGQCQCPSDGCYCPTEIETMSGPTKESFVETINANLQQNAEAAEVRILDTVEVKPILLSEGQLLQRKTALTFEINIDPATIPPEKMILLLQTMGERINRHYFQKGDPACRRAKRITAFDGQNTLSVTDFHNAQTRLKDFVEASRSSSEPSLELSTIPTTAAGEQPPSLPSTEPSNLGTLVTSVTPTSVVIGTPSSNQQSVDPIWEPSGSPTRSESSRSSLYPSPNLSQGDTHSESPSVGPTVEPSQDPTKLRSAHPSNDSPIQPSFIVADTPSDIDSSMLSNIPTGHPRFGETGEPSTHTSKLLTDQPTMKPAGLPTDIPSFLPSFKPTHHQSSDPSRAPSLLPSSSPSVHPTIWHSSKPSISTGLTTIPTSYPSTQPPDDPDNTQSSFHPSLDRTFDLTSGQTHTPSLVPTSNPSSSMVESPTQLPSIIPSSNPTMLPSHLPSIPGYNVPSLAPSASPTGGSPSNNPSFLPSSHPSVRPSSLLSAHPINGPSSGPTTYPSLVPAPVPSTEPTKTPSISPSALSTGTQSYRPTELPSETPLDLPSRAPSDFPSPTPTISPSDTPSGHPSTSHLSLLPSPSPSAIPSNDPSEKPSKLPSFHPSHHPSLYPTALSSKVPISLPSHQPHAITSISPSQTLSSVPSEAPSNTPASLPSRARSDKPSVSSSALPSSVSSTAPSLEPTVFSSESPSLSPSISPSAGPKSMSSEDPSFLPTTGPSHPLSTLPSVHPSFHPSSRPSLPPSILLSFTPSDDPTKQPSAKPSTSPSKLPSLKPSIAPSLQPSSLPSQRPTKLPSFMPSGFPSRSSSSPSEHPSLSPSLKPSESPSLTPSAVPSNEPSSKPSILPSRSPTLPPSGSPSSTPSIGPSKFPSGVPSFSPSSDPSESPSSAPSRYPSTRPSSIPSVHPSFVPSSVPSHDPSSLPSGAPSLFPTTVPSVIPSLLPSSMPSHLPSLHPSVDPSTQPSTTPSILPSELPSTMPSIFPSRQPSYPPSQAPSNLPSFLPSRIPSGLPSLQPQVGAILEGSAGQNYGSSVALSSDGSILAVGARHGNYIRVYQYDNIWAQWNQLGEDIEGKSSGDWFGQSMALSTDGLTVAGGAIANAGNGLSSGNARIFTWDASMQNWVQLGQDLFGEAAKDEFGWTIDISSDGSVVAVGARFNDGSASNAGQVRVFSYNTMLENWIQIGQDLDGDAEEDNFGWSVALSADGMTLAAGGPYNAGNGAGFGHVRVFTYQAIMDNWTQLGQTITGKVGVGLFGYAVALSSDGRTVAGGSPYNSGVNGIDSGHVSVFTLPQEATNWVQVGQDLEGEAAADEFGTNLALSVDGQLLAVGAPFNDDNGENAGQVRIFEYNVNQAQWEQVGMDLDGEASGDLFGGDGGQQGVAISGDKTLLAVGAPLNGDSAGKAYVFNLT